MNVLCDYEVSSKVGDCISGTNQHKYASYVSWPCEGFAQHSVLYPFHCRITGVVAHAVTDRDTSGICNPYPLLIHIYTFGKRVG